MKTTRFLSLTVAALCSMFAAAQQNWIWMNGSSVTANQSPTFGTQGTAASSNQPGSREGAVTWTDASGNMWLFGGYNAGLGYMADLWKYSPSTGQWTWVKGPSSASIYGVYGTQGTASSSNYPGSRAYAYSWADNSGNLWLFGGYGWSIGSSHSYLNDTWKYTISTNQWTWMKGSSSSYVYGTYGTQGAGSSGNSPGSRMYGGSAADASGNGWIFGGYGYTSGSSGQICDLWKFDVSSGNWIWMKGSSSPYQYGSYGTKGTAGSSNLPGAREACTMSGDAAGNLWLYGGNGYSSSSSGNLNDLWKYNISSGNWTWMSGSSSQNVYGVYGTQGTGSTSNFPGARYYYGNNSICDNAGNFYIFGGYGNNSSTSGYLNDLWRYAPSTGQWTWLKGSNATFQYGTYGTMGTGATNNTPGGRYTTATWRDGSGNYWVYGGYGYNASTSGYNNDLWKYEICQLPNTPVSTTSPSNQIVCSGNTTSLTVTTNTGTVNWYNAASGSSALGTGTLFMPSGLTTATTTTVMTFYAEGSVSCGVNLVRAPVSITVNPRPVVAVSGGSICAGSIFVLQPSGASTYTYSGGSQTVSPAANQTYSVYGTNSFGCASTLAAVAGVTVHNRPVVSVNSGTICTGKSFTITPSGASSYSYSAGSAVVSPTVNTSYLVTGFNTSGCASQSAAISNVIVYALPQVTVPSGTICSGQSFTFSPMGAASYTFSGGSVVSPGATSIYSVIATSPMGCVSSVPVTTTVHVNALPQIAIMNASICRGNSYVLSPSGASTYTFSSGTPIVTPSVTSTYTIGGTDVNGCVSGTPGLVTVSVTPLPTITVNSGSICAGGSFTLMPSGAATFTFVNGGPVVTPAATALYFVTGSTADGCTSTSAGTAIVSVEVLPVISVNSGAICTGDSFTITPSGAATFSISGGSAVVSPTATSAYSVTGSSSGGCVSSNTAISNVVVNATPAIILSAITSTLCTGETTTLLATGANGYTWTANPGNTLFSVLGINVVTPAATTSYTVAGKNEFGCTGSSMISLQVDACTGLTNEERAAFSMFPNPNDGRFSLRVNADALLQVLTVSGQVVHQQELVTGNNNIATAQLANGIYFARIVNGSAVSTVKFIIQ